LSAGALVQEPDAGTSAPPAAPSAKTDSSDKGRK
jgi:hypothetical protein